MSRNRSEQRRDARTYGLSRNITPRMFVNGSMVLILNQITDWEAPGAWDEPHSGESDPYLNDCEPRAAKTQKQIDACRKNGQKASARAKATGGVWIGKKDPHTHLKS